MTAGTEPALTASEWLSGINRGKSKLRTNAPRRCSTLHFDK